MTLAVTGSTGALGQLVARALSEQGVEQRLLVRDLSRAPALAGAFPVLFAYDDHDLARSALAGVDTLFMVSGAEAVDRLAQHRAFVDAAVDAGVQHIVYTSFFGAAPDCTFTLGRDHWATEEHIRASGLAFTFLRDNFYLELMRDLVGEDGVLRGPAGEGRVSAVSRADIARSAVAALLSPADHAGSTYDLTGPEALTFTEIAAILSAHSDTPVTFHDETLEEAYASRLKWPAEQWEYDAWVSTYTAVARGELAAVSDDVRLLTGRDPVSLETLLADTPRSTA
ncbi:MULTISPECIES: SDR family oxidoreductase [unclassified Nocardioides]|uniref:SDR family oxidoreductase n=1 Tax=unclassified Nocardioides TaxID=2615069 RepID=UPI000A5F0CC6|nr:MULTISPECIES: SDR family oxidoreductase [unclassified Nocardioides]